LRRHTPGSSTFIHAGEQTPQDYLLAPTETYERAGDVPNVVFPSSAVVNGDTLRLYYGCADTCISIAEGRVSEIVDFVKTHSF
jgi:beta-1,4-mannooligosaccharide/beta-1,4-mannosyl-N-acetylglucosamine phosphorylase